MMTKEELRQYHHERWLKIKADPELHEEYKAKCRRRYHCRNKKAMAIYLAQHRDKCRQYREKNKDKLKERSKVYRRRWREKLKTDPERLEKYKQYEHKRYMKSRYGIEK